MHIGFADDDGAGIQQFLQRWRIPGRPRILQCRRAARRRHVCGVDVVLDHDRQAGEGTGRLARIHPGRRRQRAIPVQDNERVEVFGLLRALERGPHGADGRHLLAADVSDDLSGGGWIGVGHG